MGGIDIFTVSFFGHRRIDNAVKVTEQLESLINNILITHEQVGFLIGRDGEFDILVASIIRRCRRALDHINSSLVLVLPYVTSEYRENSDSFDLYYDAVEICEQSTGVHFKAAHRIRNQWMTEHSDLVICYVEHSHGGAYQAMKYAEKMGVDIINLSEWKR